MSSEWRKFRVEELTDKIAMGPFGSNIKVETFVNAGVPIVSGDHLRGLRMKDGDFKFITEEHAERLRNSVVIRGDVIFTHAGNIGQVAYIPETSKFHRYVISQRQFYARCDKSKIIPQFLAYFFHTPEGQHKLLSNASQVGVPSIARPSTHLKSIELNVPSIEYQKSVCEVISTLDDRITLLRETNATLEAIAQALFKSWFVDFDPVRAKREGRHPEGIDEATAALFPDSFEESELGAAPKGWGVVSVAEVADVIKGKSYSSKDLVEQNHTALVTLKSFERGGGFRLDGFKPYTGNFKPSQVVESGDLIIAYTDVTQAAELIGKPAIVVGVENHTTLVASLDVGIVRPNPARISRQFLYGLFRTEAFQSHTYSHTSGTTVLHLAKDGVGSFAFSCPPIELVNAFSVIAEHLAKRRQTNSDQMRNLSTLRDTLLPRLISGRLRLLETEQTLTY